MRKDSAQEKEVLSGPNPLEIIRQKELELESSLKETQAYASILREQAQKEAESIWLRTEEKIRALRTKAETDIKEELAKMESESLRLLEQQKKEDSTKAQRNFSKAVQIAVEEVLPK